MFADYLVDWCSYVNRLCWDSGLLRREVITKKRRQTMKYTAFFYANGNIAITDEKEQIPELQSKGVPILFAEFLESKGYDPP